MSAGPPQGAQPSSHTHPFDRLTPQALLDVLDSAGLRGDGRLLQLNSYENRVFQVMLEDGSAVVAKFYRPGRWSDAQILEEHGFAAELAQAEVPVVAPLALTGGQTLVHALIDGQPFRVAAYPRRSGHGPELDDPATLRWLGRFIARLHTVGQRQRFAHRQTLDVATFGHAALARLVSQAVIPPAQIEPWRNTCQQALAAMDAAFAAVPARLIRLHGDCHPGNILWRDEGDAGGPHTVDLDDAVTGPAVQDLWMLLSGGLQEMRTELTDILAGYEQFTTFDRSELALIEPLRALRMIHYSAWLAQRWHDPAFPKAFPWFAESRYWEQHYRSLDEQLTAVRQPVLEL